MNDLKLLHTFANNSYLSGYKNHYSGNSYFDISEYIIWAREFEQIHQKTDWDNVDYMLTIELFANQKIKLVIKENIDFN